MTKLIPILSGRCLVVELPEGQQPMGLWTIEPNRLFYVDKNGCDTNISLPPGNWRIIGMLSEVTEEQAALVVPIHRQSIIGDVYKNFKTDKWDAFDALESIESAIKAEGWYFENPVKIHTWASENADDYKKKFDDAQSRTLPIERTLILEKI